MDLVRSWLGQALRATGAAVVVPVAILVALSLTAIGGSGLGGLGALSQLVSGPQAAGSDLTVDTGDTEIGDAVTELAAANASPVGTGAPGTTAPGTQPGSGGDGGEVPGGATPPPGGGNDPGDIDNPRPPGGGNGPEPPEPPRPPPPGVVEGVGETVKDVTDGTPVAPTVEDAVDGLVDICRGLSCP